MEFKDYYNTLGIDRDAKADEIKRAYRRLARKYHPDVSKDDNAEVRFKEMKEAYEVLKDPEKRAAYDKFGKDWKGGQDFQTPPGWQHGASPGGAQFSSGGDFSEFFESLFGGGRGNPGGAGFQNRRAGGENVDAKISISVEDAYHGASRQISLELPQVDAQGRMGRQRRTLNLKIPKGITAGQRIRLEGQGSPGINGGPPGDLFLQVDIEPHALYQAKGRDLHVRLPITPWEAALGRTVKAPTLGGTVDLKIPVAARSGQSLRLKGRGLPGKPPGDQYVELEIVVPESLSDEARALYEQLEQESQVNPRLKLGV